MGLCVTKRWILWRNVNIISYKAARSRITSVSFSELLPSETEDWVLYEQSRVQCLQHSAYE